MADSRSSGAYPEVGREEGCGLCTMLRRSSGVVDDNDDTDGNASEFAVSRYYAAKCKGEDAVNKDGELNVFRQAFRS